MRLLICAIALFLVGITSSACSRGYCADGHGASASSIWLGTGGTVYKACNRACHGPYAVQWNEDHPDQPFVCQCSAACPCHKEHK